jgi:hypothetical protein
LILLSWSQPELWAMKTVTFDVVKEANTSTSQSAEMIGAKSEKALQSS